MGNGVIKELLAMVFHAFLVLHNRKFLILKMKPSDIFWMMFTICAA